MSEGIGLKEAVRAALHFVADMYADQKDEVSDFLLEEIEESEDGQYWLVTVGFTRPRVPANVFESLGSPVAERVYKLVHVRKEDGQPVSMRIRELA